MSKIAKVMYLQLQDPKCFMLSNGESTSLIIDLDVIYLFRDINILNLDVINLFRDINVQVPNTTCS